MGGPWVSEVCRYPEATFSGLGSLLLIRAAQRLLAMDVPRCRSLSPTATRQGQPMSAWGFEFVTSAWKVQVPGVAGTPTPTS